MHSKGPIRIICSSRLIKPPPTLNIILFALISKLSLSVPIIYLQRCGVGFSSILITGKKANITEYSSSAVIVLRQSYTVIAGVN